MSNPLQINIKQSLYKYINEYFDFFTNKNNVSTTASKSFQFTVTDENYIICLLDHHDVKFYFDNLGNIEKSSCSCGQNLKNNKLCSHVTFCVYKLLREQQTILELNNIKKRESSKFIETGKINSFRAILANTLVGKKIVLKEYLSNQRAKVSDYKCHPATISPDNTFTVKVYKLWYSWNNEPNYNSVSSKYENQNFFIKCDCSDSNSNKICEHQYVVLCDNSFKLYFKEPNRINFQNAVTKYSESLNMSKSLISKIYDLQFRDDHYLLEAKKDVNLLNRENFKIFNNSVNSLSWDKNKFEKSLLLKSQEENDNWKNALFWHFHYCQNNFCADLEVYAIEGKQGKLLDQLATHFSMSDDIKYFDKDQFKVFNLITDYFDHSREDSYDKFFRELKVHSNVLIDMIHYYSQDYNVSYSDGRLRKTNLNYFKFQSLDVEALIRVVDFQDHYTLALELLLGDMYITVSNNLLFTPAFILNTQSKKAFLYKNPSVSNLIKNLGFKDHIIPASEKHELITFLNKLQDKVRLVVPESLNHVEKKLTEGEKTIYLQESGNYIILYPRLKYG
ncbi:MAG TPA: hypothetical protein PK147_11025, partial [Saprospiraceae bacterium]|nr:hypothetical protein [Saprospiraceae bacterium]